MCARYGTGDCLKSNIRNCGMRIRLTPFGGDFLRVHWRICGDNHYFFPSGVMGSRFSYFLAAVYGLYDDYGQSHSRNCRGLGFKRDYPSLREDGKYYFENTVFWDEEGRISEISFVRISDKEGPADAHVPDPVQIAIRSRAKTKVYTVDGRDLCYAVAKGCTEALKKYGFRGYSLSTSGYDPGDFLSLEMLLFVKAYALDALDVCKTTELWAHPHSWPRAEGSCFMQEIELLLLDM